MQVYKLKRFEMYQTTQKAATMNKNEHEPF